MKICSLEKSSLFAFSVLAAVAVLVILLLAFIGSAHGQVPQFSNIIIVVQENRTPDNFFSACSIPGADLVQPSGGSMALSSSVDPSHSHPAYLTDAAGKWTTAQKKYVQFSDIQSDCALAAQYGFANRMFQTNQGPSFPAHQFLFAGTSAPGAPGTTYAPYFVSENGGIGCTAPANLIANQAVVISPAGKESTLVPACFEHATLSDLLDVAGLSWKYYAAVTAPGGKDGLWNTPLTIAHICGAVDGQCEGEDWLDSEVLNPPQILSDIANGTLANVSWVTPAASYSDHPGFGTGGPAWIASIVNAVGQSAYWQTTAILITWDDWGGWYDHVAPLANATGWCTVYCYGFRVPLLVVSAYTPSMTDTQVHDFGSLLRFVETNFGLSLIGPGTYADAYADDLSNFFPLTSPQPFVTVPADHDAAYFLSLEDSGGPDDD
jgi:phospholipase C